MCTRRYSALGDGEYVLFVVHQTVKITKRKNHQKIISEFPLVSRRINPHQTVLPSLLGLKRHVEHLKNQEISDFE